MSEGQPANLRRVLGLPTAIAMVVGSVIGSGIFFKPNAVAPQLGSFDWILGAWVLAGLVCLLGALSLAELASALPRAGGLYVYLREAYGELVAFLYGWSLFLVVRPAATGSLATAFAFAIDAPPAGRFAVAVGVIVLLAGVNIIGVHWGGRVQTVTTVLKIGILGSLSVLPFVLPVAVGENLATTIPIEGGGVDLSRFMVALLAILFAYNSWHEVTPLAEEIQNPQRNVPLALGVGMTLLITLYATVNVAYHATLPMDQVAAETNTAAAMMRALVGEWGAALMTVLVMGSVFGTINANLLHAPRVYFAMGRDGVFFSALGRVHSRWRTPAIAILCQATLAVGLIIASTFLGRRGVFDQLSNIVVFGSSLFYALGVLAVVVLRRRQPDLPRPYRTWGYPLTPLLYVLAYAVFLPIIFAQRPLDTGLGFGLMALGLPAYFYWRRRRS